MSSLDFGFQLQNSGFCNVDSRFCFLDSGSIEILGQKSSWNPTDSNLQNNWSPHSKANKKQPDSRLLYMGRSTSGCNIVKLVVGLPCKLSGLCLSK